MAKTLLEWSGDQDLWTRDSLRRVAAASDYAVSDDDLVAIRKNVIAAARLSEELVEGESLDRGHLGISSNETRRTAILQLGPVENIDRLAPNQQLRFAPAGITLVYGENGSGKSGYTRIAKRLCRSLAADDLRGNVFAESGNARKVTVRYKVGDDEPIALEWDPQTDAPGVLQQISVFDSGNARLYVDTKNRVAYLPKEIAILEHHGEICQRLSQGFATDERTSLTRISVPFSTGYSPGSSVTAMLARLDPARTDLPIADELNTLAELSDAERGELVDLERELAADPMAMAAARRRMVALLGRIDEVLVGLQEALSNDFEVKLAAARATCIEADKAVRLSAMERFANEPFKNTGTDAWRILFEAARAFAISSGDQTDDRLPAVEGDLCLLCQEPLSEAGASRIGRFNDFISSEASRLAQATRTRLEEALGGLRSVAIPSEQVISENFAIYAEDNAVRAGVTSHLVEAIRDFERRRAAMVSGATEIPGVPELSDLLATVRGEHNFLEAEAHELEHKATHPARLDEKRARLAVLRDRNTFAANLPSMLQRHADLSALQCIRRCLQLVNTRAISTHITALRKEMVTAEFNKRIQSEIEVLDLKHIPFQLQETSSGGQNLFSIGLHGVKHVKNNQVLSEGEQRALALACFLAEIGDDREKYGMIIDDPVSSLDHIRMRRVAKRLVAEAAKGRQVVIFTHSIVFFNEIVSEASRFGEQTPLVKTVIRKTDSAGFGVIEEDKEPWVADLSARIGALRDRAKSYASLTEFDTESYRRLVKDFYSDLRETWERAVEELVLNKTIVRFVPDVMTTRLKAVGVDDDDYRTIYHAMKHVSERSGHDMSSGRDIPQPKPSEMADDLNVLDDFRIAYRAKQKRLTEAREKLEEPVKAILE
ncbi:AAA family ATPase [Rhizobium laguerreae]|uniref:AAA family ATPase n=1 Tax=Rhizobium laguerreae TaxID=1076926 RepID=UPI001D261AE4|nr:AAA family ATPase [Rhizobium laguerreae]MBY3192457.1 AAA family ATPase [Rhizobium laguerreae]MBY3443874.1 AAA family ATPase [Rhizobium laguerreae]